MHSLFTGAALTANCAEDVDVFWSLQADRGVCLEQYLNYQRDYCWTAPTLVDNRDGSANLHSVVGASVGEFA